MGRRKEGKGVSGRVFAVCDASAVEEEGVVGVGMVRDKNQQSERVRQDVGQLEPRAVIVHSLKAGLVGLVRRYRKADGIMNNLGQIARIDDDDLEDIAERKPAVSVHLPDAKANQGAQGGIEGGVGEGGRDRVSVGE